MLQSKARWRVLEQNESLAEELADELGVSRLVARLLVQRGFGSKEVARRFLHKDKPEFYDPYLLKGMKETVARIHEAVRREERILVFGDYDADGVSSISVLLTALRMVGADCDYYIPNRFTEGYGPNIPALKQAKEEGYSLIVTVDTGIAALEPAAYAKEAGLDFIVTDHHEPPPELPEAYAIINPKQPGCTYPFDSLAGVGVAFKVAHALLERVPEELLDYAVIGTIADLVPLIDENRLLAKRGLKALEQTARPGLRALKDVCGIGAQSLESDHVGFGMGPRLNAAGRLDSAGPAVELLLAEDEQTAKELAAAIDELNKERQGIVNKITEEAIALAGEQEEHSSSHALIVAKEGWNAGVIGIVASRLVERYYRPTIVMSIDKENGLAKGSARSIEGFDMFQELSVSRDILPHFGGHPMAAGLTMKEADIGLLRERLNQQAYEHLTSEDFIPVSEIDVIAQVEDVTVGLIEEVAELAPFGVGNRKPSVLLKETCVTEVRRIGSDSSHLKIQFAGAGAPLDGIAFRFGHLYEEMTPQAKLSAVGTLSLNEWNGRVKAQLMIEDVAIDHWQLFDWRSIQPHRLRERLLTLPEDKRLVFAFQKETKERLGLTCEVVDPRSANIHINDTYCVLLDLPNDRAELGELFTGEERPSRVYAVFSQEEETFFRTNPNREQFKWYYAFLRKQGRFHLDALGKKLEQHKGWTSETVGFMTDVFVELEFVSLKNGYVEVNPNPAKTALEASATFHKKQEQTYLENEFVYASYQQLREWFDGMFAKEATTTYV
ncbi:single-stranded-DNA-specific exonuclease RecJ [Shouchella shacheensis]|uniref:single-stranded-DNA-specific exonuclease RecJ n=1 Tax=Shouchella shacheensis TaxID=1649580 RepID=UPI00074007D1|nr:single-stranded-DNA-specific exonuclease RecJ [Shouchella shacheensis]